MNLSSGNYSSRNKNDLLYWEGAVVGYVETMEIICMQVMRTSETCMRNSG